MIEIEKANERMMLEIAKVHIKCFPNSFSSSLKANLISKYYLTFLNSYPDLFLVARDQERIVGFVMGYPVDKGNQANAFLKNNFFRFVCRLLIQLIKIDKRAWKKVLTFRKKQHVESVSSFDAEKYRGGEIYYQFAFSRNTGCEVLHLN